MSRCVAVDASRAARKTSSPGRPRMIDVEADCEVARLRRVADVAEVDDAGDPAVARRRGRCRAVKSPCTIWAPERAPSAARRAPRTDRATAPTSARRSRPRSRRAAVAASARARRFHSSSRAGGWMKNPRSAMFRRACARASSTYRIVARGRLPSRMRPGRRSKSRTTCPAQKRLASCLAMGNPGRRAMRARSRRPQAPGPVDPRRGSRS